MSNRTRILLVFIAIVASAAGYGASVLVRSPSLGPIKLLSNSTYLFGQLSFSINGDLYFVDMKHSQIDEVTGSVLKVVVSMPKLGTSSKFGPSGIGGLSLSNNTMWFSANGNLYEASLDGQNIRRFPSAQGVGDVDVLSDGTVLYDVNNANGVYERTVSGATKLVAGGSDARYCAFATGQSATSISAQPTSLVGLTPTVFYYVDANELCLVASGRVYGLGHDFHNGQLAIGPNGTLYTICGWDMCRVDDRTYSQLFPLQTRVNGDFFQPLNMAVSPSGTIFVSYSDLGGGNAGIVSLSSTGKPTVIVDVRHS